MAKGKIQINEASRDELAELPGIGPATADSLIKLRDQRGGFKSVDDLEQVPGLRPQALETLRASVAFASSVASNGGSAARKAADAGSKAAETAAKTAETAPRALESGAKTAARNGEAAAEKIVEVGRSATESARGVASAQAGAALRTVETAGAKAEYAVKESAETQHDLLQAARQAQEVWLGLVQEQMSANVQVARRLAECRTPQELAEVQVEYLRGSMERLVHGSARVAGPAAHLAQSWWSPQRWQQLTMTR